MILYYVSTLCCNTYVWSFSEHREERYLESFAATVQLTTIMKLPLNIVITDKDSIPASKGGQLCQDNLQASTASITVVY